MSNLRCDCLSKVDVNNINPDELPEDCPEVAELFASGDTCGIFQLETGLGKTWTKKLKPVTIDHLAALVAILRPGCLDAKDERGISVTEHYCLRKNGVEEVPSVHPVIDECLAATYGLIIYQESYMQIARDLCNFTPGEVNKLRKATAKKDQKETQEIGKLFIKKGLEADKAEESLISKVWENIRHSVRYSFVKAHSYSYGGRAYQTAWLKVHAPHYFYTSWLSTANAVADPLEEMRKLTADTLPRGIRVLPPSWKSPSENFFICNKEIRFGISDIRGIGEKSQKQVVEKVKQIQEQVQSLDGKISSAYLCSMLTTLGKTPSIAMIESGVFRGLTSSDKRLLTEFEIFHSLTATAKQKATEILQQNPSLGMSDLLKTLAKPKKEGGISTAETKDNFLSAAYLLDNPPASLEDSPAQIAAWEESRLGVALSCTKAEGGKSENDGCVADVLTSVNYESVFSLCVEVVKCKEIKTKNGKTPGQKMAFVYVKDISGYLDVVVFPDAYKQFSSLFREKNIVRIHLKKDAPSEKNKNKGGLILIRAEQAFLR